MTNDYKMGPDQVNNEDDERISLHYLSELTGFPVDYIKKELVLENDELPMKDLRDSMINFLDLTAKEVNKEI